MGPRTARFDDEANVPPTKQINGTRKINQNNKLYYSTILLATTVSKYHAKKFSLKCDKQYIGHRLLLHKQLPSIASTRERTLSRDVKRLSFRCQTLKFPRPNVNNNNNNLLVFPYKDGIT